jgi:hypothetical protein
MSWMEFTKLTVEQVEAQLVTTAADVRASFGHLDSRALNWRPSPESWSVAQCLDHLAQANRELCIAMSKACDPAAARTIWQKLPVWPGIFGRLMIRTQGPTATRKFTAPPAAVPSVSHIDAGVIDRFVDGHAAIAGVIRSLAGRDPAKVIMVSPFVTFISYSVLDALRLIAAHERRHYEQARRVLALFDASATSSAIPAN